MINEPAVVISAIAACISAFSALIAVWNYRREHLNQRISAAKWKKEYFADLLKWSDEAMLLLSESLHLCDLDPKLMEDGAFFEMRHAMRIKLSAQIDRGRWFFPNHLIEMHGLHKHEAFRGYRPATLKALVDTYRALTSLSYTRLSDNMAYKGEIKNAKRLFTSEIQKVLNPRDRDREFGILLRGVLG